jgi:hypothetical protein
MLGVNLHDLVVILLGILATAIASWLWKTIGSHIGRYRRTREIVSRYYASAPIGLLVTYVGKELAFMMMYTWGLVFVLFEIVVAKPLPIAFRMVLLISVGGGMFGIISAAARIMESWRFAMEKHLNELKQGSSEGVDRKDKPVLS